MDRTRLHRSGGATAERERDDVPAAVPAAPVPLRVGAADDRAEVEADRRADQVLARLAGETEAHAHGPGCDHGHAVRRSPAAGGTIGLAGGDLDAHTDALITSRLGTGQTLDAGVRRDMEGAFGRSFSGVRVHADGEADQLNRQLSSTAFTVGSDVFFRGGAYRPDDRSGQRLLAHELAHVEQDGGGAHRTIHRAVGFEFESCIVVKKKLPNGKFVPFPKAAVLKKYSSGLQMTADESSGFGSTIEWVIDPPIAENDRDTLVDVMADMVADAQTIQSAYDANRDKNARAAGVKTIPTVEALDLGLAPLHEPDAWVVPDRYVVANPQITGGVDFAKVIDMMAEIGNGAGKAQRFKHQGTDTQEEKNEKDQLRKGAGALDKVAPDNPAKFAQRVRQGGAPTCLTQPASKELQGLAALLISYLDNGSAGNGRPPFNYAKLISGTTLVRTDFGTLFNKLPEMGELICDRQSFVDWILALAQMSTTPDEKVYQRGVRRNYHKAYKPGEKTDKAFDITRQQWLMGIAKGYDALSAKSNPALKPKLEGLGALGGKMDAVGDQVDDTSLDKTGVIMEFRRMGQDVMLKDWTPLALMVFDYLVDLNDS